jgi:hypothetical protein
MSFFTGTHNPFWELHSIRQLRITLWRVGFFGLASHVKDFSLLAHILWMAKNSRSNVCASVGSRIEARREEEKGLSGDVRMKAFNDPLNNLIQHKELKGSCEN